MSYSTTIFEAKVRRVWHIDHLRAVCGLLGAPWRDVPRRVLSVGCGTGVHLIPLACQFPSTTFIGCDPEGEPLFRGKSFRDACELQNVSFVEGTAADVGEELFDLVLVQGVYSWINSDQQNELLAECVKRLAPNGVMLLTHNVAPGWTIRKIIQQYLESIGVNPADLLLPADLEQARNELKRFSESINHDSAYGALISAEIKRILGESSAYLRHEFLNPETSGEPLTDIVGRAARFGLSYLGDARFSRNPFGDSGQLDRARAATARDFQRGIPYRESLFTRQEFENRFSIPSEKVISLIKFGSILSEDEECPGDFRDPMGREFGFSSEQIPCLVLRTLSSQWPRFLSWGELSDIVRVTGEELSKVVFDLISSELITIAVEPPSYSVSSTTITAPRWLNLELAAGSFLTNRLYEPVALEGFESMLLSAIASGVTSIEGLIKLTTAQISTSPDHRSLPKAVIVDTVRDSLRTLARAGLVNEIVED